MALSSQSFLEAQPPEIQAIHGIGRDYRIEVCQELEHVRIVCPSQEQAISLDEHLRHKFWVPKGYRLIIAVCPSVSRR